MTQMTKNYLLNYMTKYEVRVTQTFVDYYQVECESEEQAKNKALSAARLQIERDWCKKVDTIQREPIIDYALQLTNEGEVII